VLLTHSRDDWQADSHGRNEEVACGAEIWKWNFPIFLDLTKSVLIFFLPSSLSLGCAKHSTNSLKSGGGDGAA